jgi:hypothetical protein
MRGNFFKQYVRGLAAIAGGTLLLVIGINAIINPFNLYDGLRIRGVNDYKYRLIKHQRLSKPAEILRLRPDCLILGTSRVQVGLDPAHPGWGQCRVYNLALNRAGIYESMRYYQHAAALERPQKVVLELGQIYGHLTQGEFKEERLLVKADGSPNRMWWREYAQDIWSGLASLEALRTSWQTVIPSYERRPAGPVDGFWEYTPQDPKMLRHGQRNLFRQIERSALSRKSLREHERPRDFRSAAVIPRDEDSNGNGYQYLRAILRQAHRDGTQMYLVITPQHARAWYMLLEGEKWSAYEAGKRMMVFINEDEARLANREPFPLWDFSGFNSYTTEPVPAFGDFDTRMHWFWDGHHFTKELGDLVLDRVLGSGDSRQPVTADFGVRLTSRNLEAHISAIRAAGDEWRRTHPKDVAEIASKTANGR